MPDDQLLDLLCVDRRPHRPRLAAIQQGSCPPVEPELAAFGLLGAANWVAFWYPRTEDPGARAPEEIAAALAENAVNGGCVPSAPPRSRTASRT